MRREVLILLLAGLMAASEPPKASEPRPVLGVPITRHMKMLEGMRDIHGLDIAPWPAYLAFFNEHMRPGFTWMLGADRKDVERGFRDGAYVALALREDTSWFEKGEKAIFQALVNERDWRTMGLVPALFKGLARRKSAYQMGFMTALEKASVLQLQRPVHELGTLALRPPEVCLPVERFGFSAPPGSTPAERDELVRRQAFFEAKTLRLRPQWGSYLGAQQEAYEEGFRAGVALWDWDSHGVMSPRAGQDMLKAALQEKALPYRHGFMAGMEARSAFLLQEKRLRVRVLLPARTPEELSFLADFNGFVPDAVPIPAEEVRKGRTLLEIVGLHRVAKCVVSFPGKDAEDVRKVLGSARYLGRKEDHPFSGPVPTHGYLQCYDGRTLPFEIHLKTIILVRGMYFAVPRPRE